jgi:hypothetical protein
MPVTTIDNELAALHRLVKITENDSGQCRRVASFLLAWWNAADCGGFDLTELWAVDEAIANDMLAVMRLIARQNDYPTAYGLGPQFERMVKDWRPQLFTQAPE